MIDATVTGIPDFVEALTSIPRKLRRRALLNALKAGARLVQQGERAAVPQMSQSTSTRTAGLLYKKISVRTSSRDSQLGDVGVFVNIKPAQGTQYFSKAKGGGVKRVSQRGANSPLDPFYWKFVAFGTKHMAARDFLSSGVAQLPDALTKIIETLGPEIQKLDTDPKNEL